MRHWVSRVFIGIDKERFPRLHFALEVTRDLLLIGFVDTAVRIFYLGVLWVHALLPSTNPPPDLHSYLPVVVTRWLVTVTDTVAIFTAVLMGVSAIINLAILTIRKIIDQWKSPPR
jgi:hypothetical protein